MTSIKDYDALLDEMRERFEHDTTEHQMAVLHDDGLYRHLRFQKPGTSSYYYDLITWPGHLAIAGDCGDYMFARISDMGDFFDGETINPGYWSEKLQGPGQDMARSYSEDRFKARVKEWVADTIEWDGMDRDDATALSEAVDAELLQGEDIHYEDGARAALRDFVHRGRYIDAWEWDLRDFEYRFLWCCWAILRGLDQYRAKTPASSRKAN